MTYSRCDMWGLEKASVGISSFVVTRNCNDFSHNGQTWYRLQQVSVLPTDDVLGMCRARAAFPEQTGMRESPQVH